jgi:hypothetical protein
MQTIQELVRKSEQDFTDGVTQTSDYVEVNLYEDIQKIDAYLNSKHTTGEEDSLGREKPFFNICVAKKNIRARGTDLDRRNIRAKAKRIRDTLASYVYTAKVQEWMDKADFGKFLNVWGDSLATYNESIVKFVKQKGELKAEVVNWNSVIVDQIDFANNPVIEIFEVTPAQLKKNKNYDQDQVKALCDAVSTRTDLRGMNKDNKANYIKIYEVHGELPLSLLTGNERDEDEYVQQMHIVSFVASNQKGEFDDFTLYSGREAQSPYMLTWLLPTADGSIKLNGTVKELFEAQWMKNHTAKTIKDVLDNASKIIYQTADPQFANKNVLTQIEHGQIMVFDQNVPNAQLTQINNSHDVSGLMNYGREWEQLANEVSGTPDILKGETLPSGTAYRQAAILQSEAHANLNLMLENKGLHLERMFREYITPYIMSKLNNSDEIVTTLDAYGIDKIDKAFVSAEAIKRFNYEAVEAVINEEELPTLEESAQEVRGELSELGGTRFLKPSEIDSKTWKEVLKDFEANIVYEITGENEEKQAVMDTLTSVFNTIVGMQGRPMTKEEAFVFNKILGETRAMSPLELSVMASEQQQRQPMPVAPVGGAEVGAGMMQVQNNNNGQPI